MPEIIGVLRVSEETLRRWVKRTYNNQTFETIRAQKAEGGKMSLRRAQIKTALDGNPTMQIWLGKQYLGQHDKIEIDHRIDSEISRELERLGLSQEESISGEAQDNTSGSIH